MTSLKEIEKLIKNGELEAAQKKKKKA